MDHGWPTVAGVTAVMPGSASGIVVVCAFDGSSSDNSNARELVTSFGGSSIDGVDDNAGRHVVAARFSRVCDATHAATSLTREFRRAGDGTCTRPTPFHMAIDDFGIWGERPTALLAHADRNQIVTTSATAVIAGSTLPSGAEFVDHGDHRTCPCHPDTRLYELVVDDEIAATGTGSNLVWARRAARATDATTAEVLPRLADRWERTLDNHGSVVLLTSPDGTAASSAAAELALAAHAGGGTVLRGRWDCQPQRPYVAFREALGLYAASCDLSAVRAALDDQVSDMARLIPELGAGAMLTAPPTSSCANDDCRLGDAVSAWLGSIAERGPVLLVLEHAEWADRRSVDLCEQLGNDLVDTPFLALLCGAEQAERTESVLGAALVLAVGGEPDDDWVALDRP